jgi:translation initiation factor IF-2
VNRTEPQAKGSATPKKTPSAPKPIELPGILTVKQLADLMDVSPIEVIKQLMRHGVMANINQVVSFEQAYQVTVAFEMPAKAATHTEEIIATSGPAEEEETSHLIERPPVVTILGHVDHGKTTLLDVVRRSNLTEAEVGGITQHIGAYQVEYKEHLITFLDTPGHEAFTAMRARGAQITDIAVLVVAADDGVMPQTVEAINHVKSAEVPIIVAINKMDRPGADIERVKRQLSENNLLVEEWGGNVIAVPISAKTGEGIPDLLENLLVLSEISELKANPARMAAGVVVEARLDKSKGPLATILIKTGTLRVGDHVVVDGVQGKIRALINDEGRRVNEAGPSFPVETLGLSSLPKAGDSFIAVKDERAAREISEENRNSKALATMRRGPRLEDAFSQIRTGESKARGLNLIIKADAQGSTEAVRTSLERLSTEESRVRILHAASGTITESDVLLATAAEAIIIAFNTRIEPGAKQLAAIHGAQVRFYDIIYTLIEDIEKSLAGLLEPEVREIVEGHAEVRAIFPFGRQKQIAGVYVTDGKVTRNAQGRVTRGGQVIHQGPINSLRHFKNDVREMAAGFECGLGLEGFKDFQVGDIVQIFHIETGK